MLEMGEDFKGNVDMDSIHSKIMFVHIMFIFIIHLLLNESWLEA